MTTPDTKGAQPEQLVEEVREYLDRFTVGVDMLPPYLLDLVTALSECRRDLLELRNEVNCRIEHGAESGGHLEYVQQRLDVFLAAQPPSEAATTFQWLIERGQPEGETNAIWLENSARRPARDKQWTRNAWDAAMFPTREVAEAYIVENGLAARAVEHGFAQPPSEASEAKP